MSLFSEGVATQCVLVCRGKASWSFFNTSRNQCLASTVAEKGRTQKRTKRLIKSKVALGNPGTLQAWYDMTDTINKYTQRACLVARSKNMCTSTKIDTSYLLSSRLSCIADSSELLVILCYQALCAVICFSPTTWSKDSSQD